MSLKEQSNTVIQMVIAEIEWSVEFEVETVGFKEVKGIKENAGESMFWVPGSGFGISSFTEDGICEKGSGTEYGQVK